MIDIGILGPPPGVAEGRVLLTPRQAGLLVEHGVRVVVERGAGDRAGYLDADYDAEGATVTGRDDVLSGADVLLAVSRPRIEEVGALRRGAVLMGFYHLDLDGGPFARAVARAGAAAVGLERARTADGRFPFRERMAEVAGVMAAQLAAQLLLTADCRGVLLGGVTGVPPAQVAIVGAGALGRSATRAFSGAGAQVLVLDRDLAALDAVERERLPRVTTMLSTAAEVADAAASADVVVGAVRVPEGPPPKLASPYQGKPCSVWLDLSVDEGGCFEASRPVYSVAEAYTLDGVVCCPVPNLASWAARTASRIGSALLAPTLLAAAEAGELRLADQAWLAAGAMR